MEFNIFFFGVKLWKMFLLIVDDVYFLFLLFLCFLLVFFLLLFLEFWRNFYSFFWEFIGDFMGLFFFDLCVVFWCSEFCEIVFLELIRFLGWWSVLNFCLFRFCKVFIYVKFCLFFCFKVCDNCFLKLGLWKVLLLNLVF